MYYNLKPKNYSFIQLMNCATEIMYLLRQASHKVGNPSEVYWIYNRAMHDMTLENSDQFNAMLLARLF